MHPAQMGKSQLVREMTEARGLKVIDLKMSAEPLLTFGQLTELEQGALLLAHHQGKPIERVCDSEGNWIGTIAPCFVDNIVYRVKPI